MSEAGKSAVIKVADSLDQGSEVGRTRGAGNSGDDELDLFGAELEPFEGMTVGPAKRRAGRPAGSPNRSTLQLQKLLMQRGYRDPAEFLASIVTMDTRALAASLKGVDVNLVKFDEAMEALKVQRSAAEGLMPYFHQKLPLQIEAKGDAPRTLIVMGDMVNPKSVTDQRVSEIDGKMSHDDVSHDEG